MTGLSRADSAELRRLKGLERADRKAVRQIRQDRTHPPVKPTRGRVRDNTHLAWIRRLPCIAGLVEGGCDGSIEAAHVRFADAASGWDAPGMQRKPSDDRALPLCRHHHQQDQHTGSERAFWARLGVWPPVLCKALYAASKAGGEGLLIIQTHLEDAAVVAWQVRQARKSGGTVEPRA